jgi:predicted KAP-like P-loop ATPase
VNDGVKRQLEELATRLDGAAKSAGIEAKKVEPRGLVAADQPISSSTQDRLNRTGFAGEIAKAILGLKTEESLVIGIHGAWGTGKTSLLNLIREQLEQSSARPPLIVSFNPWDFSDQGQLTGQFFDQLATFLRLHRTSPVLEKVADTVLQYGQLLDPIARFLVPRVTEGTKFGLKLIERLKPRKRTAMDLKEEINSALRRSGARLIVMIDDIDRLNRTEIRQAFQLVKINANFANTVYIVAFDVKPVERALRSVAPASPRQYLDKIIQLAFTLPPVSEAKLTEILITKFNETFSDFGIREIDPQRFGNMFHSGFRANFHTLRDMNRYLNVYRFALGLIQEDTNPIDLAATQCLSLFHAEVFSAIWQNPALFCGGWGLLDRKADDDAKAAYDAVFNLAPDPFRESVISLCTFLFPKLERFYGALRSRYSSEFEARWEKDKRVAAARYFHYYFELVVPESEVRQAEMNTALRTLESTESFLATLRDFKGTNRFGQFVELLRNQLGKCTPAELLVILESIFVFGDEVSTEGTEVMGLISDHLRFASWLLLDVLDRLPKNDRFKTCVGMMKGKPAVFTVAETTATFEDIFAKIDENPSYKERFPDLTNAVVGEMKSVAIELIVNAAKDGRLLSSPRLPFLLYRWKDWVSLEAPKQWVGSTFLGSPRNAALLVSRFAQKVASYGVRDRVANVRVVIDPRVLGEFADLNQVAALLNESSDTDLTQEEISAKNAFLGAKAKVERGEDPSLPDFLE